MKTPHYTLALAAMVAWIPPTLASTTAKEAIETLKTAEGANITNHIVRLTGRFGQDQPQEWEVLARRGNQFAMYIVDGKSVISVSKIRTRATKMLSMKALKLDSKQAFRIADKSAKLASIGFDSLSYDLKPRSDKEAPVWIVRLSDTAGFTVGEIHIAADSGTVLLTNWDRLRLNRPAMVAAAPPANPSRGMITDRRTASVQTGTTMDGVRGGLANVGNSIRGVFRKGEVSNPERRSTPKTTKSRPR